VKPNLELVFCILAAIAALGGCKSSEQPAASNPAPAPAAGPNLELVAQKAPAVLYFVKTDCGSNPAALPLVQSLYAANSKSEKFYVVLNADASAAAQWAKDNNTTFPIIPDPDKEIIEKYNVEFSQTGVLVDSDLKEVKRFAGYGKPVLEDLNKTLGGDGPAAAVDLSAAPPNGFG
jgi:hypothetical protein